MRNGEKTLWLATERLPFILKVYPESSLQYDVVIPERLLKIPPEKDPLAEVVRGRLEIMGPVTAERLADLMGLPISAIDMALLKLENEGFVFQGNFSNAGTKEWCERRLLARIHRYTIKKLRSEIEPVSSADFMRFLFVWHQLGKENQSQGVTALEHTLHVLYLSCNFSTRQPLRVVHTALHTRPLQIFHPGFVRALPLSLTFVQCRARAAQGFRVRIIS